MCRIFVPISTTELHMSGWHRSQKRWRAAIWNPRSSLVAGSWNVCTPGSTARGVCWFAGRSWISPIKPSCISLVASSVFNTVIAFFLSRFPNKLLVLLGMPGLDKRLARAPQLYSRIGFAHQMEPLSEEETRFFLDQRWSHRVSAHSDDFTDQEAVAAILRIARGNIRLIERLMMQVEHVLVANQLTVVTKEVIETARENLIIGD